MKQDKFLANDDIRAPRLVVIGADGTKLGEFLRRDALQLAEEQGLDLVVVGDGEKPVCKIMDLGKHLYELKKKMKKSHTVDVKEIKFGFSTDQGYIDIKAKQARQFLEKGDKVKVTIEFKGRESSHLDIVRGKCYAFFDSLADIADLESQPKIGQGQVNMVLAKKT